MEEIVQVISNLGVPVAIAVYCLLTMERQRQENRQDAERWCDAINRNTEVINRLLNEK